MFIFKVVFEAVRGNGYQSDIALDEISLIPGSCVAANPLAPSTSTFIPITSIPIATTQTVTSATTNRKGKFDEVPVEPQSLSCLLKTSNYIWTRNVILSDITITVNRVYRNQSATCINSFNSEIYPPSIENISSYFLLKITLKIVLRTKYLEARAYSFQDITHYFAFLFSNGLALFPEWRSMLSPVWARLVTGWVTI